jgi:hypothetical protein
MGTEALLAVDRRGNKLQYITQHFGDLQGLRLAPLWAAFLLLAGLSVSMHLSRWQSAGIAILILVLLVPVWLRFINAWYRRHYGMVVAKPSEEPLSRGSWWTWVAIISTFGLTLLFRNLDRYMGDLKLWPFLILTVPRCFDSTPPDIVVRLRRVLYFAGSLAIVIIIGGVPLLHLSKWVVVAGLSGTLLLLSFYDHWLFAYVLGDSAQWSSHD